MPRRADRASREVIRRFPTPEAAGISVTRKQSAEIEGIECESALSFHGCAPDHVAQSLGLDMEAVHGASLMLAKRSSHLYFNRASGLGMRRPAGPREVAGICDWFRSRGVRRFSLDLSPLARTEELPKHLVAAGFRKRTGGAKLVRDAGAVHDIDTGLRIEEIGADRSAEWFGVIATTWTTIRSRSEWFRARVGQPGWRHYLAYDGVRPVAAASMFAQGHAARLCEAVTIPTERRRGAQSALIARRLQDGIAGGARIFASETAAPLPRMPLVSYTNMVRAGFPAGVREGVVYVRRTRATRLGGPIGSPELVCGAHRELEYLVDVQIDCDSLASIRRDSRDEPKHTVGPEHHTADDSALHFQYGLVDALGLDRAALDEHLSKALPRVVLLKSGRELDQLGPHVASIDEQISGTQRHAARAGEEAVSLLDVQFGTFILVPDIESTRCAGLSKQPQDLNGLEVAERAGKSIHDRGIGIRLDPLDYPSRKPPSSISLPTPSCRARPAR